tara:strand:+ start:35 stop:328 length:294 start_codon:yes stop_codon:yes gene_type:complete
MGLAELAAQLGIQLAADAIVDITNQLDKLKKDKKTGTGSKTISDQDKVKAIKAYVSKKPTMLEVAGGVTGGVKLKKKKGGGYIKKYAKGSMVKRIKV